MSAFLVMYQLLTEQSEESHRAPVDALDRDTAAVQISALARVVVTRTVALAPTLLVALLANAPNQLDVLNQWLNILQSIQLPFAIIPVRPHCCVTSNYACLVVTAW